VRKRKKIFLFWAPPVSCQNSAEGGTMEDSRIFLFSLSPVRDIHSKKEVWNEEKEKGVGYIVYVRAGLL